MTDPATYSWPTCATCRRDLRRHEAEAGTLNCGPCRDRVGDDLAVLPGPNGLYAALRHALTPGQNSDIGPVSGSRTAPLPIRLAPLSLSARGGVVTVLQDWQTAWWDILGYIPPTIRGSLQQQLDDCVKALSVNLDWAAAAFPAFPDFAAEVACLVRACRNAVGDERPERRVAVQCDCGATLRITLATNGARCRCDRQYAREDLLELPLAARAAA